MGFNVSANFISLKIGFTLITSAFGQILSRIIGQILRGVTFQFLKIGPVMHVKTALPCVVKTVFQLPKQTAIRQNFQTNAAAIK